MTQIQFYEQTYDWIIRELNRTKKQVLMVGINGSQGIGKTTLCAWLAEKLNRNNIPTVSISIDDFYLTRKEQIELANQYPSNPYLQERGYPGTHDITLGLNVLQSLKNGESNTVIPVYDKSAHSGKGDRAEESKRVGACRVVLLEGWMLGFTPQPASPGREFSQIDHYLEKYKTWTGLLDAFIVLMPEKKEFVLQWRVEAEEKMKKSGKSGMTTDEVRLYAEKFLPAYERYLPALAQNDPLKEHTLRYQIGFDRLPKP